MGVLDNIYGSVIRIRNKLYDNGTFKSIRVTPKVISVGNISVGGSGKTPLIISLAKLLTDEGLNVGIIGHGYKRVSRGYVSTKDYNLSHDSLGDEAMLIFKKTGADCFVDDKKWKAALKAESGENQYDVLLLDDGFQHRKLERDCDIVILDNTTLQNPFLLPKGRLREPLESLKRADIIIKRGVIALEDSVQDFIGDAKVFDAEYKTKSPLFLDDWFGGNSDDKTTNKNIIAFSALANNTSFHKSLKSLGFNIIRTLEYKDHHSFIVTDYSAAIALLEKTDANYIAVTEKDAIKMDEAPEAFKVKCIVFPLEVTFRENQSFLEAVLNFVR
ncbi:MAG: tetraacyldisaccharide 4'-kinase [Candidatus Kapaibacteriales bacterium]